MKKILAPVAALGLLLAAPTAHAMPLVQVDTDAPAKLTLVWGGCGPYGHRGPWGGCRPGGQWSGWGGGYGWRRCPIGYHLGPYRRACWPN